MPKGLKKRVFTILHISRQKRKKDFCVKKGPKKDHFSSLVLKRTKSLIKDLYVSTEFGLQITRKPTLAENYTISVLDYVSSLYSRIRLTDFFVVKDLLRYILRASSRYTYQLSLFSVLASSWWVERMLWQVRVSSLLSSKQPAALSG